MPPTAASTSATGGPVRPSPYAPYHPTSDQATYRDLLLFEERLKMNAEMLRRRRNRYSVFLYSFIGLTIIIAYRLVFLPPQALLLFRALQALLAVVFITLVLFFASGMYEEKIRYAHSYINHSNKALRPLNMHLNMRISRPSLLSHFPFLRSLLHLSPTSTSSSTQQPHTVPAPAMKSLKSGPALASRRPSTNTVLATIPPSSNPRGELIFASRVHQSFREGYERYRANFERRREEKAREERGKAWWVWRRPGAATAGSGSDGRATPTPPMSRRGTPPPSLGPSSTSGSGLAASATASRRRSASPLGMDVGNKLQAVTGIKAEPLEKAPIRPGGLGLSSAGTDTIGHLKSETRERAESYSFVLETKASPPSITRQS